MLERRGQLLTSSVSVKQKSESGCPSLLSSKRKEPKRLPLPPSRGWPTHGFCSSVVAGSSGAFPDQTDRNPHYYHQLDEGEEEAFYRRVSKVDSSSSTIPLSSQRREQVHEIGATKLIWAYLECKTIPFISKSSLLALQPERNLHHRIGVTFSVFQAEGTIERIQRDFRL